MRANGRPVAPRLGVREAIGGRQTRIQIGGRARFDPGPGDIGICRGRLDVPAILQRGLILAGEGPGPIRISQRLNVGRRRR
jgi:hypothetical protein